MCDIGSYNISSYLMRCERRKKKLKYWMNKGCTYWKAQKLLERYGY